MNHQQKLSLGKWLLGIASIVGTLVTALSINWGAVAHFASSAVFLYDHSEELEHIVDDYHQLLQVRTELDSVKKVLFETKNRDSLISVISHLNHGKFPYDSIWVKGPSGTWYVTTMEKHFTEDHE